VFKKKKQKAVKQSASRSAQRTVPESIREGRHDRADEGRWPSFKGGEKSKKLSRGG